MKVEVKLYAALRRYRPQTAEGAPHHSFTMNLPEGITVAALAAQLGIPDGLLNAAAVNGQAVDTDTPLKDSDTVGLFPPAAGGHIKIFH